jgi:hypothetical protein
MGLSSNSKRRANEGKQFRGDLQATSRGQMLTAMTQAQGLGVRIW